MERKQWDIRESYTLGSFLLCNLHVMYRIINSGRLSWTDHVARVVEVRSIYRILVGKRRGRMHGRHKCRWKNKNGSQRNRV